MPGTKSKKEVILEYCRAHGLELARAQELRAIQAELRRALGPQHASSLSYIANVVRQAGTRVDYDDRYVVPSMEEPYASRLEGLLQFRDFETAEAALRKLDQVYREYREVSDRVGTDLVRSLVLKGKQRAASLATRPRVSPQKRQEKQEIANWFKVWLEVPDLFFDWLELRKSSEEFQRLFASQDGQPENTSIRDDL